MNLFLSFFVIFLLYLKKTKQKHKSFLGLIGVGSGDYLSLAGSALSAFHVPVVAVDPDIYTKVIHR